MIPQIEPWIDDEELKQLKEVIDSTWITEASKTKRFEENFKTLVGVPHALAYANGTSTLFAALKILGVGRGDEVIVPALTFAASINAIIFAGAKPILVDVDKTFNINPDLIEKKITKRTKAIMPVHLYGQSADMDKIMKIAERHELFVIEDAAQGVGVKFNGRHVGSFGEFGSFSFYGNKTITMGEGGAIVTSDKRLADAAYRFKNHGRMTKGSFVHEKVGFNFSITEMQAAVGLAQLGKLKRIIDKKEKIRNLYLRELGSLEKIKFPYIDSRCSPVHWFTTIFVDNVEELAEELKKRGIQTRRIFYPMHLQPCYSFKGEFPMAEKLYEKGLSLPSSAILKEKQILEVCKAIKEIFRKK